ncbi:MAG: amylo-alpha-1,6-glucosidase [Candidatus Woesearchaeota archaeon]
MKRKYKILNKDYECEGNENCLVTNNHGSYFSINPNSNFNGWYIFNSKNWILRKVIDSISPIQAGKITEITNLFYGIRRKFENKEEDILLIYNYSLLYNCQKLKSKIKLTLDNRNIHEPSKIGRNFEIKKEENYLVIKFTEENKENYIAIKGIQDINIINNWREINYSDDKKRNSQSNFWIYDALEFSANSYVVFSYGETENIAKTRADIAFFHFDEILNFKHTSQIQQTPQFNNIIDENLNITTICAFNSLNSLINSFEFNYKQFNAIYAGLPWFFQIWARDELITLGGLISSSQHYQNEISISHTFDSEEEIKNHNLYFVKKTLSRYINSITLQGRLPSLYPETTLGSIDAFGWLGKRVYDFITHLNERKILFDLMSDEDLRLWFDKLYQGLQNAKQNYGKQTLFANAKCETWMDTSFNDDGRAGYSIEIQTLFLALHDALLLLAKLIESKEISKLKKSKEQLLNKIKEKFVLKNFKGILVDRITPKELNLNLNYITDANKISELNLNEQNYDKNIRCNIFLAAYIYPNLFERKQWENIFDFYLENLLTSWGGITTISKDNGLFQLTYTGENNKSYHRGDSWYFVNNLTALILYKINKEKYHEIINKLIKASVKDILEQGFMGHASELSSAEIQESCGTKSQAWSSATFLELMMELYK